MSVATKNFFAPLDEDGESRSSTPAAAPTATKETAPAAPASTRGKRGGGPAARGGRYYSRGGGAGGAPRDGEEASSPAAGGEESAKKRFDGEGRGDGRGRGRGRGRGARGAGRGGRPFDRHSSTGIVDTDKKIHQGWGGDEGGEELKAEEAGAADATNETVAADGWDTSAATSGDWGAPTVTAEGATPAEGAAPTEEKTDRRPPRVEEEEDNTLTLEQYLAQKKADSALPTLETRKVDDDEIKGTVLKKGEEEEAYFAGKSKSTSAKPKAKKEEKVFLEIDARFERPQRGGGFRGGRGGERGSFRGGERGGRGRGEGRGRGSRGGRSNGSSAPALALDDASAFPTLS